LAGWEIQTKSPKPLHFSRQMITKKGSNRSCPLIVRVGLTVLTLGPSHDQVFFEVPSDIKRLSEGQTVARALPFHPNCAVSPRDGCFAAGLRVNHRRRAF